MTEAPRRLATDGREGFPTPSNADAVRVYIDGDLKRGVIAYDALAGWVDVIMWDQDGVPVVTDDGDYIAQRYRGTIKAVIVD